MNKRKTNEKSDSSEIYYPEVKNICLCQIFKRESNAYMNSQREFIEKISLFLFYLITVQDSSAEQNESWKIEEEAVRTSN